MTVVTDRVNGFVHSVDSIKSLSSGRDFLVSVSERTLYLLANFSSLDVTFLRRYAVGNVGATYEPVTSDDPDFTLVLDSIDNFIEEVTDYVTTTEAIDRLTAAVERLTLSTTITGCGCTMGSEPPPPIVDGTEQTPPPGYVAPTEPMGEIDYKCAVANVYVLDMESFLTALIQADVANLVQIGVGLVSTLIGSVTTGALIAAGPIGWASLGLAWTANLISYIMTESFDLSTILAQWQANSDDMICALYSAVDSGAAKLAHDNLIDTWALSSSEAGFLKLVGSLAALTSLWYTPQEQESALNERINSLTEPFNCASCGPTELTWELGRNFAETLVLGSGDIEAAHSDYTALSAVQNPGDGNYYLIVRVIGNTWQQLDDNVGENVTALPNPVDQPMRSQDDSGSYSFRQGYMNEASVIVKKEGITPPAGSDFDVMYQHLWSGNAPFTVLVNFNPGTF